MYEERLQRAHTLLKDAHIGSPVAFRLLRKVRLRVRPPHFRPFLVNILGYGVLFSLMWALYGLFEWQGDPWTAYVLRSVVRGFSLGTLLALIFQLSRWTHNLPRWDQLQ